jgi:hypothetical protein
MLANRQKGLSDVGLMQPWVPRAHQSVIIPRGLEGIKLADDAFAHQVIKPLQAN